MSVHYNETSYDTCPIYHYILGEAPGFGFRFFALFATGAAEDRILLLAATAVSSYEASTILEEPLGRSGKKLPKRTRNRAHLDAGFVRRSAACVHPGCYMFVYRCCRSSCDVIGEGGVLTTKTKEGESGGIRVG